MLLKIHQPDYKLILLLGFFVVFGLIILSSTTAVIAYQNFGDSYYFVKKQLLFGVLPGLFLGLLFSVIPYRMWRKIALFLLLLSIGLLGAVFIPGLGSTLNTGSNSWLVIYGISVQPSEIVKLTFLLYLASWLERRGEDGVKDVSYGFLPFLLLLGTVMGLMILQPDIGTMTIIVFIALSVYFVAGARLKHLLAIGVLGAAIFAFLVQTAPYRLARFMIFLNPEFDPQGIGYHTNQALLAIGSGGLWGRGFGQSRQKFNYLPEVTSDSIFPIMAEELGFLVSSIFLFFLLFFAYRGFSIAKRSPDAFGRFVAVGITSWLIFQSIMNIGSMVGVLPMTGVPLPFLSYGGTAMMINLAAVGILLNITKYTRSSYVTKRGV